MLFIVKDESIKLYGVVMNKGTPCPEAHVYVSNRAGQAFLSFVFKKNGFHWLRGMPVDMQRNCWNGFS